MNDDKFKFAYQYGTTKPKKVNNKQLNATVNSPLNQMHNLLNTILTHSDPFIENEVAGFIVQTYADKNNQQLLMKRTLTLKNEIIDKEEFDKIIKDLDEKD